MSFQTSVVSWSVLKRGQDGQDRQLRSKAAQVRYWAPNHLSKQARAQQKEPNPTWLLGCFKLKSTGKSRTTPERSALMSRVRQRGTAAEENIRRVAVDIGIDFETNAEDLPGRPDLANRSKRWAVFVHGCYWHAHEGCRKWTIPKSNRQFWLNKFADNRKRDESKKKQLENLGYRVGVIWECETKNIDYVRRLLCGLDWSLEGE